MDQFRSLTVALGNLKTNSAPVWVDRVSDYAPGDNATTEMGRAFAAALYNGGVHHFMFGDPTFTGNFQTIRCGFDVGLFAIGPDTRRWPGPRLIYHNVAPRKGQKIGEACGEKLYLAILKNGTLVMGPNAGYCWSFIREEIASLFNVGRDLGKFQFRSADDFPKRFQLLLEGDYTGVEHLTQAKWDIPGVPHAAVCMIDNYGNCKVTIPVHMLRFEDGQTVRVIVPNGEPLTARVALENNFTAGEGNLSFGAGSSRFRYTEGPEHRWMELFVVGGNAAQTLKLKLGDEIKLEAA